MKYEILFNLFVYLTNNLCLEKKLPVCNSKYYQSQKY